MNIYDAKLADQKFADAALTEDTAMNLRSAVFLISSFAVGYATSTLLRDTAAAVKLTASPFSVAVPRIALPAELSAVPENLQPVSDSFRVLMDQDTVFDTLHRAFELASRSDLEEAKAYASASLALDDPLFHTNVADVFLERISALNVRESISFVESLRTSKRSRQLMLSVLTTWVRMDADAALFYLRNIKDLELRRFAASVIAKDTALPREATNTSQEILTSTILELRSDLRLMAAATSRPGGGRQFQADAAALEAQLKVDPTGTMTDLMNMPSSRENQMLVMSALSKLALSDLDLAMSYIEDYPSQLSYAAGQVLSIAAQAKPEQFRDKIEEHARRTGDTGPMGAMIQAMMKSDKQVALDYYAKQPSRLKRDLSYQLAHYLVEDNPYEGVKWMLQQSDNPQILTMVTMSGNPKVTAGAETLLSELPTGTSDWEQLLVAVAASRSQVDPASAITWLDQFRGESGYDNAYGRVLVNWAGQDPASAAEHLARVPVKSADANQVYGSIVQRWVRSDPDAVEAWAAGLQDDSARQVVQSNLVSAYTRSDLERARKIYFRLPEGPDRDRAGAALAVQTAGDPSRWREAMEDLGLSDDVIQSYITVWTQ